ncbi:hypothetical protein BAE42_19690 [Mesorhizobium loti]|uniref:Uncharacterized protein n=1 Tax=Rhizobium loti TaxID=381 RepID=A0A1A5I0E0_RHILI|nr:hypothetical protein BAE42_19690 [Mesorhizobium loti]OBP71985.1 hypothetical protein BAE41_16635 [Mesorhizobium loti]OBP72674.1 hypothetical protein BAE39_19135 [Mesorhizobium loti]OBP85858.1 hypothetical protein BAE38_20855 [Mesorhizobium loti]OBP87979.1 hypothetical protein BAE40_25870 [Mesorhizobium loti]
MQHFSHQRLADAAAPARRLDIHVRAPGGADSVRAAHAPNDIVAIHRHILAERRAIAEQTAIGRWRVGHQLKATRFDRAKPMKINGNSQMLVNA